MSLGGPGGDTDDVVAALRAVAGVFDAEILPDDTGGPGTLRLQLEPGADEVRVATTVHRLLGDKFGLGVDAGRVQVVEEAMPRRPMRLAEQMRVAEPEGEPLAKVLTRLQRAEAGTGRHAARPSLESVPEPAERSVEIEALMRTRPPRVVP